MIFTHPFTLWDVVNPFDAILITYLSFPKQTDRIHLLFCGQWDSNPHGCPLAPKTSASANSAMSARHRHGLRFA